jgi:hypothetical protein
MSDINILTDYERILIQAQQYEVAENGVRVEIVEQRQVVAIREVTQLNIEVVNRGAKGDKGDSSASYEFIQATPSNIWTIPHNMGRTLAVTLYSIGGVVMIGTIINISNNVMQIQFEIPVAGTARLV